jgi:hypothetical protein
MTNERPDSDPIHEPNDFGGAAAPDASLAARIDRSTAADRIDPLASGTPVDPTTTPVPDRQETGPESPLVEGRESAPRSGRVDAAGATFGPDADRVRIGQAAAGGPPSSVGGALEPPPGEGEPGSLSAEEDEERRTDR